MKVGKISGVKLAWFLLLLGCGESGSGRRPVPTAPAQHPGASGAPGSKSGAPCRWAVHDPCGPGLYCRTYRDAPVSADAVCFAAEDSETTRLMGTVWDFTALLASRGYVPVAGAELRFAAALAAVSDVRWAWDNPLGAAMADDAGRYDLELPLTGTPLGVVATIQTHDDTLTANGVAIPLSPQPSGCAGCYGAGANVHDTFVISRDLLARFSQGLGNDSEYVRARLPLGERGGAVGIVRELTSGEPIAGARVLSRTHGKGQVRYLNEDLASFNPSATTSTGVFVIIGPSLAEGFNVELEDGSVPIQETNPAGSTPGSILLMAMNIP